jgi:transcription elongation GreA/GreB family factor
MKYDLVLVTLKIIGKTGQQYQIVGVDEDNKGKISFISPIARILINKSGRAILILANENRVLKLWR